MKKRHTFKEWMTAVRPWSFPASAMPVAVTVFYLLWLGHDIDWIMGAGALVNMILFHAAGNTWSDYHDYVRKVDCEDTFGARSLTDGIFSPEEIKCLSAVLLSVSVAMGIVLTVFSGPALLWTGVTGAICMLLYPQMKYRALGDIVIFVTFALLPALGTSYVTTGMTDLRVLWPAFTIGIMTVAILHANNMRDTDTDRRADISTLVLKIGGKKALSVYLAEIAVPFVCVVAGVISGIFPLAALVTLAAAIPAAVNVKMAVAGRFVGLDEKTAGLEVIFGVLLCCAFACQYLINAF